MASPDDAETTAPRRQAAARKTRFMRSRVGNGKTLMAGVDQRSLPYREFQDTVADLTHHMGGSPTVTQQAMLEEAAGLVVWCRAQRVELLQGGKFDIGPYTTAVNALRRLLVDLGLDAKLHDVTPTIEDYFARKARERATDAEEAS